MFQILLGLKTCYYGNPAFPNHASRVNPTLFVKIFTCKRGAKYERLSVEASRTFRIPVHTSRSHFTANSGYKETPTTPSVPNSGLRHIILCCPVKIQQMYFSVLLPDFDATKSNKCHEEINIMSRR